MRVLAFYEQLSHSRVFCEQLPGAESNPVPMNWCGRRLFRRIPLPTKPRRRADLFCSISGGRYKNIAPLKSSAIRHTRKAPRACLAWSALFSHAADRAPPRAFTCRSVACDVPRAQRRQARDREHAFMQGRDGIGWPCRAKDRSRAVRLVKVLWLPQSLNVAETGTGRSFPFACDLPEGG